MTIRPEDLDRVDVARKVALGGYKWTDEAPSVLPAFVAEHDLGPFPGITDRLRDIVEMGGTGYHDR
ncbi:MAG: aminotransferase class I/II, partial [Actinomycetota bacterium]|nr:aminotransferase class I/II [Actinomycetota bacterium]